MRVRPSPQRQNPEGENMKPKWMKGKHQKARIRYSNDRSVRQWIKNGENFSSACTEKRNGKEGHVYVFLISEGVYKIGRTYNIQKRLKSLSSGNPGIKCIWSAWSRDCFELEKRIHIAMRNFHVDREFFSLTPGIIKNINDIAVKFNQRYE